MDVTTVIIAFVTLALGAVVGFILARLISTQTSSANQARYEGEATALRNELTTKDAQLEAFRAEASRAREDQMRERLDVATAQSQVDQAKRELAEAREQARSEVGDAREQAAQAEASRAGLAAKLAAAEAERDAAIDRAKQAVSDREAMVNQFKTLSAETLERHGKAAEATAADRLQKTEQLLSPVAESLRLMQERITEVEKARTAMSAELGEQVRSIVNSHEVLRRETNSLTNALRAPQIRGAWGEQSLKRIVEVAGMVERCDFFQQASTHTADGTYRPDLTIHLAGGKVVFVDSKVSLTALLDAYNTEDEAERADHLQRFAKRVRTHIDDLSRKNYWALDAGSPEFVVMFMASEESFYAALQQQPDLQEYAGRKQIVLASPSILIGLLKAIAHGWQQARLAETATEVQQLGRELYERLSKMGDHFEGVGRGLTQAMKAYNSTVGSLESRVMVTARKFNELEAVTQATLKPMKAIDETVREITAPELLAAFGHDEIEDTYTRPQLVRPEPSLAELVTEPPIDKGRDSAAG